MGSAYPAWNDLPDVAPDSAGVTHDQLTELAGLLQRLSQIEKRGKLDAAVLKSLHGELARLTGAAPQGEEPTLEDMVRTVENLIDCPPPAEPIEEPEEDLVEPPPFAAEPPPAPEPVAADDSQVEAPPEVRDEVKEEVKEEIKEEAPAAPPLSMRAYLNAARHSAMQTYQPPADGTFLSRPIDDWLPKSRFRQPGVMFAAGVAGLVILAGGFIVLSSLSAPHHAPAAKIAIQAPPDWKRVAAEAQQGNAHAEAMLGLHDLEKAHDPVSQSEAINWLQRAADHGEPTAQFRLATLYATGHGVERDDTKAAQLYALAANGGNRNAMYNFAVALVQGDGIPANPSEAARWFLKAAQAGVVDAQFDLAVLYERGLGTPQSLVEAYRWYVIAAAAGDPQARTRVNALSGQLTEEERDAAAAAAKHFKAH